MQQINTSGSPALYFLKASNNQLTDVDLSNNPALSYLYLENNNLTSLNLQNGSNTIISYYNSLNNANLSCIQVDDATYSTTNWSNVDSWSSFSGNCSLQGCMDPLACNYNSLAWIDDGSCINLIVIGSTDNGNEQN